MSEGLHNEIENLLRLASTMRRDAQWAARTLATEDYLQTLAADIEMIAKCLQAVIAKQEEATSDGSGIEESIDP